MLLKISYEDASQYCPTAFSTTLNEAMYPKFRHLAVEEGNRAAVAEYDEQIEESKVHAAQFRRTLEMAAKRFAALAKVEQRHANHYQQALDALKAI